MTQKNPPKRVFSYPDAVGSRNVLRHRLFGQLADRMYGSNLHLFIDACSAYVQSTTEDEGEAQYVVYLVRIIRATGSHDHVGT